MNRSLIILLVVFVAGNAVHAQVQQPRATTQRSGPPAASLATPYSGPVKFDQRVLASERAAAHDPNPITRGAAYRRRFSAPANYYWNYGGYCGYRSYRFRGFYPFTGGATSLGWWGPY